MEKLGWYQTLHVTGRWHGQNLYLLTAAEENKRPNPMQIFNQTKNVGWVGGSPLAGGWCADADSVQLTVT